MDDSLVRAGWTAFWFGIVSAASLPLGVWLGIVLRPKARALSVVMSFGAGALLAALTLELVSEALHRAGFWPLATGAVVGGLLFAALNQAVNARGAFLRKFSTTVRFLTDKKRRQAEDLLARLSHVRILRELPPEEIQAILPYVHPQSFRPGEEIFAEGSVGDALYLIEHGEVEIARRGSPGAAAVARLGPEEVFGELALLTHEPRSTTATAVTDVRAWAIGKKDFERWIRSAPHLSQAVQRLTSARIEDLSRKAALDHEAAARWREKAMRRLDDFAVAPTSADIQAAAAEHGSPGAPMAIFIGSVLDNIPESLMVGASMVHAPAGNPSLLAGIFLSNLPESMSSAVGMRRQGYSAGKLYAMWTALMVIAGVGSWAGRVLFAEASPALFATLEGAAAGAMLAMVSETMLPEAYEQGGAVVGLSTLLGFLCALYLRSLQPG